MTDINELRRLAQAASPGPWIAKNTSGAGLEIYMSHPVYPDKDWPAFGTDSAFCTKGLVSYETWTQFPHEVRDAQQAKNALFIAAANPAAITELLDRLEAWENVFGHLGTPDEVGNEWHSLSDRLEAAEKDIIMKEGVIDSLAAVVKRLDAQCDAAETEALEQARLNGMGAERELALMAKLEAAAKAAPGGWHVEAGGRVMDTQAQRRLLEQAAKSAGILIDKSPYNGGGFGNTGFDFSGNAVIDWHNNITWNPLTDDGDALRLAVALRIKHERHPIHPFVAAWAPEIQARFEEPEGDDPYAATRLAIVRAAAEIGKNMETKP